MPHFKLSSGRDDGEESSDSDHRYKRRKMNQMRQSFQDDPPNAAPVASPANPNSFAAKMMSKMGYKEGQGLGATGRGRLAPIETQQRPQGAGLGAVKEKTKQAKEEEKREAAFRGQTIEYSSEEEKKRRKKLKEERLSGVVSGAGTPRARPKPKYKTAAEIQAEADGLEIPNVLKSLIDATGQETRLLTSTAGLMSAQSTMVPAETEAMKLSRLAQRESMAFADEWRSLQERKDFFLQEKAELETQADALESEIQTLETIDASILDLQLASSDHSDNEIAWELVTSKLEKMGHLLDSIAGQQGLQETAVGAVHPLFKTAMQDWDPLAKPTDIAPYLTRLKDIVGVSPISSSMELTLQNGVGHLRPQSKSTSPYETMIYTLWLPPVRSAITSWDVYTPDPLIAVIEAWKPVLPPFVLANVIDHLVVQRLTTAVGRWKPRSTNSRRQHSPPPHVWIFPWLQYLDDQHTDPNSSTGLMSDVKRKFKSLLSSWNISAGVLPGLEEWRSIFSSALSSLLVRHLLPRLAHLLVELEVDPSDQDLVPLEHVLAWAPFFSVSAMAELLARAFFPKFHETLFMWLTHDAVNYEEVSEWMKWWKQQLEEGLPGSNETTVIAAEWTKAQTTILTALDAMEEGRDATEALRPSLTQPAIPLEEPPPPVAIQVPKAVEATAEFKDVVEEWCAENGLLMLPMREADLKSGLPLFRITASAGGKGGVVVYFKGDVLWARGAADPVTQAKVFKPVGLEPELVARAEKR